MGARQYLFGKKKGGGGLTNNPLHGAYSSLFAFSQASVSCIFLSERIAILVLSSEARAKQSASNIHLFKSPARRVSLKVLPVSSHVVSVFVQKAGSRSVNQNTHVAGSIAL